MRSTVMLGDDRPHFFRYPGPQWRERLEVHDVGSGHLVTHVVADGIPRDAFRVR